MLMTPVHEVMLETPSDPAFFESPTRHNPLPIPELQTRPFIMGEHLQAAWENSAQFIELLAENLACELWENRPAEAALSLEHTGRSTSPNRLLVDWLHLHPSLAGDIHTRTATQFTDYAQQQGWLTTTTEPSWLRKLESCIICENYRFWLELQLVDDKGQPLANVSYSLASEAQAVRCKAAATHRA
ncbi:hypothetical protein AB6G21_11280 [Providencia hangzhouensis]|uniref:hypothetical protein n=1 Tax=Providencia hangzhouensis TaxID=3031799 RepID=UPI0034DDC7DD